MYSKEIREKTGVSRDTLRHYVHIGLLTPKRNNRNDYLIYDEKDCETLSFILRAKNLGFSLTEIKEIEKRVSRAACPHQSILPDLQKNLCSVQQKMQELRSIEKHLKELVTGFKKINCTKTPTNFTL